MKNSQKTNNSKFIATLINNLHIVKKYTPEDHKSYRPLATTISAIKHL